MKFLAEIDIMPLKELLDPQGKAVSRGLHNLGFAGVDDVRIGKHIRIAVDAADEAAARTIIDDACKKLLANQVMETFSYTVSPA